MTIKENVPLLGYNTFHVEAATRYLAEIYNTEDISEFITKAPLPFNKWFVMGGGSNVLFTDDFDGCIIKPEIKGIELISVNAEYAVVRAGAGEVWDDLVNYCVEKGLWGLENLSGIPGSVGAGPVQNIGAYGTEAKDTILYADCIEIPSGKILRLSAGECKFSYRNSIFKSTLKGKTIITHVTFRLNLKPSPVLAYRGLADELAKYPSAGIREIRKAILDIRGKKLPDPEKLPNAGSFFKNPFINRQFLEQLRKEYENVPFFEDPEGNIKLSAAWMIDKCGFKGYKEGNTGTHINQPLVIINNGKATGKEILDFSEKIKKAVRHKYSIDLETEVNII